MSKYFAKVVVSYKYLKRNVKVSECVHVCAFGSMLESNIKATGAGVRNMYTLTTLLSANQHLQNSQYFRACDFQYSVL